MNREFFEINFFGLKRSLPLTYLSPRYKIANFNILGDVEFTEKAGTVLQAKLDKKGLKPECFVGPEVKVVPFVHHMAKKYGHKRYVVLRKSVKGYMINPIVEYPSKTHPQHVKKLVLSGRDKEYLILKKKGVVLIDDVVSTGATMSMLENLMKKIGVSVIAKCAIFKQGDRYSGDLIYLSELPIFKTH